MTQMQPPRTGTMDGVRGVLEAAAAAIRADTAAVLALVIETEGSTYVSAGGMALFGGVDGQTGWLSGGCLEPEIERRAQQAVETSSLAWMEVDTRDDEDLLSGSALGCRGRLRIVLMPLRSMPGFDTAIDAWRQGSAALEFVLRGDGDIAVKAGDSVLSWRLPSSPPAWPGAQESWRIGIESPPRVVVFGAGPETPLLLPLLREIGWMTTLIERRPRWRSQIVAADRSIDATPSTALQHSQKVDFSAALVMHHNFELDRETLSALAGTAIPFIGLLGPGRRREDLFRVLSQAEKDSLTPRLRSPIGLKLGGQGPEAIALSIAAQLQAYRHGEETR